MHLRIGTRRSPLAMTQTDHVCALIRRHVPDVEFSLHPIATVADRDRTREFHEFKMVGVFSQEHEDQLVRGEVDFVVHSLKDLPTTLREGLALAAVPEREDPRDALCGAALAALRPGARVGTGSLRRRAQILNLRPDVEVVPIRGNVGPRLARIEGEDGLDAVILAQAGLKRLGLDDRVAELLPAEIFPYAVGQGALGLEARADDPRTLAVLRLIECPRARAEAEAERAMMHGLGAGCSLPVGAHCRWDGAGALSLQAQVTSLDGRERLTAEAGPEAGGPAAVGAAVAASLRAKGGTRILQTSFREVNAEFRLRPA